MTESKKAAIQLRAVLEKKIDIINAADELARQAKRFRQQHRGLARAYNEYVRLRSE